jgi:hypothetical protein
MSVAGEGKTFDEYSSSINEVMDDLAFVNMSPVIARLQTQGMTDEERALKSFTRRHLRRLSNWPDWDAAHDAQLDAHYLSGAFADPVHLSTLPPEVRKQLLRIQWSNIVKPSGKRKARACIDGSKRAAPWLHHMAHTYSSCIEQPCMRLFFAINARLGYTVTFGDTTNAFQQTPPPTRNCYVRPDDAYKSWYRKKHGKDLPWDEYAIPIQRAIQGHPEAGALFERLIVGILQDELGFKCTTHERNLYRGKIDGKDVLVC